MSTVPGDDARDLPDDEPLPDGLQVPDDLSSLLGEPAPDAAVPAEGSSARASVPDSEPDGTPDTTDGAGAVTGAQDEGAGPAPEADADTITVPDDPSALLEPPEAPSVALVLTQVAVPGALAAACALAKVDVDVVPTPVGAVAVLRDPAAGAAAVQAISQLLRAVPVVLMERREEQISATRWAGGAEQGTLPPGLVLSDSPAALEDLLLGSVQPSELEGVVSSVGMSRWRAMRLLASSRPRR